LQISCYGIGYRKHRHGTVVWRASLACIALKSAFARNAPRPETRREVGSMDVSGFWLGTNVDPSFRVIHVHEQTKRCV